MSALNNEKRTIQLKSSKEISNLKDEMQKLQKKYEYEVISKEEKEELLKKANALKVRDLPVGVQLSILLASLNSQRSDNREECNIF